MIHKAPRILIFNVALILIVSFRVSYCRQADAVRSYITQDRQGTHFNIVQTPLAIIQKFLENKYNIEIIGIDEKAADPITLVAQNISMSDGVKRILKLVGEENFTFEYIDGKLHKVCVYEGSNQPPVENLFQPETHAVREKLSSVVKITAVIPGSQAEYLGMRKNDLIIIYDGVKITGTSQLIKLVRGKPVDETVRLTLVQNGMPTDVYAHGGLLGVRIRTSHVARGVYNSYFDP